MPQSPVRGRPPLDDLDRLLSEADSILNEAPGLDLDAILSEADAILAEPAAPATEMPPAAPLPARYEDLAVLPGTPSRLSPMASHAPAPTAPGVSPVASHAPGQPTGPSFNEIQDAKAAGVAPPEPAPVTPPPAMSVQLPPVGQRGTIPQDAYIRRPPEQVRSALEIEGEILGSLPRSGPTGEPIRAVTPPARAPMPAEMTTPTLVERMVGTTAPEHARQQQFGPAAGAYGGQVSDRLDLDVVEGFQQAFEALGKTPVVGAYAKGVAGGLASGTLDPVATLAAGAYADTPEEAQRLIAPAEAAKQAFMQPEMARDPFADPGALLSPEWWAGNMGQLTGSILSLVGAGWGGGMVGQAVAKGLAGQLPVHLLAKLAPLGAQTAATVGESFLEASNTYTDLIAQGADPRVAGEKAAGVFAGNMAVLGLTNHPIFESGASLIKRGLSEATQEVAQTGLGNVASDRPITEGMGTAAIMGGIGGPLAGAAFDRIAAEPEPWRGPQNPTARTVTPEGVPQGQRQPVAADVRARVADAVAASQRARQASGFPGSGPEATGGLPVAPKPQGPPPAPPSPLPTTEAERLNLIAAVDALARAKGYPVDDDPRVARFIDKSVLDMTAHELAALVDLRDELRQMPDPTDEDSDAPEATGGLPVEPRPQGPPPAPPSGVSVPFMITRRMEADLRARGISDSEIRKMTPAEAHAILSSPPAKPAPREVMPDPMADVEDEGADPAYDDPTHADNQPVADARPYLTSQLDDGTPSYAPTQNDVWTGGQRDSSLAGWIASLEEMGFTRDEIDNARWAAEIRGVDVTRSDDLSTLELYLEGLDAEREELGLPVAPMMREDAEAAPDEASVLAEADAILAEPDDAAGEVDYGRPPRIEVTPQQFTAIQNAYSAPQLGEGKSPKVVKIGDDLFTTVGGTYKKGRAEHRIYRLLTPDEFRQQYPTHKPTVYDGHDWEKGSPPNVPGKDRGYFGMVVKTKHGLRVMAEEFSVEGADAVRPTPAPPVPPKPTTGKVSADLSDDEFEAELIRRMEAKQRAAQGGGLPVADKAAGFQEAAASLAATRNQTRTAYHGTPQDFPTGTYLPGTPERKNSRQWPFPNAIHFTDPREGEDARAMDHARQYGPNVRKATIKGELLDMTDRRAAERLALAASDGERGLDYQYYADIASGRGDSHIDYEVLSADLVTDPDLLKRAGYVGVRYGDEVVDDGPAFAIFDASAIVADEVVEAPKKDALPVQDKAAPRRRTAQGGSELEEALSPAARAKLAAMFKELTRGRDLRHIRAAMEVYSRLIDLGTDPATPEAAMRASERAARDLRDAMDTFLTAEDDPADLTAENDAADDDSRPFPPTVRAINVSEATHRGLQLLTGEEDPDWNNELLENEVFADTAEAGRLILETLDPQTASFDVEEFNTAFGAVEFRREPVSVFPRVDTYNARLHLKVEDTVPQAKADAIVQGWKDAAKADGARQANANKVIYSLFDVSGVWSQPWIDAGYTVRRYDIKNGDDLMDFGRWMMDVEEDLAEGREIVGILGAPPCTSFAVSGARWWADQHDIPNNEMVRKKYGLWAAEHFERPLDYANTLVAVMKLIVAQANPRFYAMENPVGRIAEQNGLPKPRLVFDPHNYGSPYTKQTLIWGEFNPELPTAHVEPTLGSLMHKLRGDVAEQKAQRSETPEGFAYAFYMAQREIAQAEGGDPRVPAPASGLPVEDKAAPVVFRSGNQRAPADLDGYIKAGVPVGITHDASNAVWTKAVAYARRGGKVFIDSGAFGGTPDFDQVLTHYGQFLDDVGAAHAGNVYIVAPDAVGDPDATRALQTKYENDIRGFIEAGANVIVPVQVGGLFRHHLADTARTFPKALVGIPGNKAAVSFEQLREALATVKGAKLSLRGVHFLGMGERNAQFDKFVFEVRSVFPDARVTSDSNRTRALMAPGRPADTKVKDLTDARAENAVDDVPAGDTTELAAEFYRGNLAAFTPGELAQLGETLNVTPRSRAEWRAWQQGTNGMTDALERAGVDDRLIDLAIAGIAKARMVKAERPGARTDVIAEMEKPAPPVEDKATAAEPRPTWMNRSDIEEAVERFRDHPVLGPASRYLQQLQEAVDRVSDGWSSWPLPGRAAGKLQGLIYGHLRAGMGAYPRLPEPTAEDVRRTLAPIKAFMTKHGTAAGITLPDIDLPTPKKAAKPAPPVTDKPAPRTKADEAMERIARADAALEGWTITEPSDRRGGPALFQGRPLKVARQGWKVERVGASGQIHVSVWTAGKVKADGATAIENTRAQIAKGTDPGVRVTDGTGALVFESPNFVPAQAGTISGIPTDRGWVASVDAPDGRWYSEQAFPTFEAASAFATDLIEAQQWPIRDNNSFLQQPGTEGWTKRIAELRERNAKESAPKKPAPPVEDKPTPLTDDEAVEKLRAATPRVGENMAGRLDKIAREAGVEWQHAKRLRDEGKLPFLVAFGPTAYERKAESVTEPKPAPPVEPKAVETPWKPGDRVVLKATSGTKVYTVASVESNGFVSFEEGGGTSHFNLLPAKPAPPVMDKPAPAAAVSGVTVRATDRNSVEIKFDKKPAPDVLAKVKAAGYRWAKGNQVWYKRGATIESARALVGLEAETPATPDLPVAPKAKPAPAKPALTRLSAALPADKADAKSIAHLAADADLTTAEAKAAIDDGSLERALLDRGIALVRVTDGVSPRFYATPRQLAPATVAPKRPRTTAPALKPGEVVMAATGAVPPLHRRTATPEERAVIFRPGNIVGSYGGGVDEVVSYQPPSDGQRWSVTVRGTDDGLVRTHATEPEVVKPEYQSRYEGRVRSYEVPAEDDAPQTAEAQGFTIGGFYNTGAAGPTIEVLDPDDTDVNGSDESEASDEANKRKRRMLAAGESWAVRKGGVIRTLTDVGHVDYTPRLGEEYGILDAAGRFQVLQVGEPSPADERRAEARRKMAEAAQEAMDAIRKSGTTLNSGLPVLPPGLLKALVKFTRAAGDMGLVEAQEAWNEFARMAGEGYQAAKLAFETAWEMVTGETVHVANEVDTESQAYTETKESTHAADDAGPDSADVGSGASEGRGADAGGRESATGPRGGRRAGGGRVRRGHRAGSQPGSGVGAGTGRGAGSTRVESGPGLNSVPGNVRITAPEALGAGTPAQKAANNVAAIRLAKQIASEGRYATADEQQVLLKYVGWGGLKRQLEDLKSELLDDGLITPDEYTAALKSRANAHYTSGPVIQAMWEGLRAFGFTGGRVLEPAMGVGHFIGLMPADLAGQSTFTGVELDRITASIATLLYPRARVLNMGFERTNLPNDSVDLAISNVPFGSYQVADNQTRYPKFIKEFIHNYFFAKALDKVRPGGLIAFITSHGTMDAGKAQDIRQYLADKADLLGAVRLPDTAFKGNAGTEVVTDVIVLRKRAPEEPARHRVEKWWGSQRQHFTGSKGEGDIYVSDYFTERPQDVIGEITNEGKMRAGDGSEMTVRYAGTDVGPQLAARLKQLAAETPAEQRYQRPTTTAAAKPIKASKPMPKPVKGSFDIPLSYGGTKTVDATFVGKYFAVHREKGRGFVVTHKASGLQVVGGFTKTAIAQYAAWRMELDGKKVWDFTQEAVTDRAKRAELRESLQPVIQKWRDPSVVEAEMVREGKIRAAGNVTRPDAPVGPPAPEALPNFSYFVDDAGVLRQKRDGVAVDQSGNRFAARVRGMVALRDAGQRLVALMRNPEATDDEIAREQEIAAKAYDAFVGEYEALHQRTNAQAFRQDPFAPFLLSLEKWDPDTKVASQQDIFRTRTIQPGRTADKADTPEQALMLSYAKHNRMDWPTIAGLLGVTEAQAQETLTHSGRIFPLPEGGFELREWYLSGRVKDKLAAAKAAATEDPRFAPNVEALEAVIPVDMGGAMIVPKLGSTWVPIDIFESFLADTLKVSSVDARLIYTPLTATWTLDGTLPGGEAATRLSTDRLDFDELFMHVMNGTRPVLRLRDGSTDSIGTQLAYAKMEEIRERFSAWVYTNADRRTRLERIWNDTFNVIVLPTFDGSHLTFEGMADEWRTLMRPHQKAFVWRALQTGNALAAHEVGLGKTLALAATAMEMKRLGLASKPVIVVPKAITEQWAEEVAAYYPNARVLAATPADFEPDTRQEFLSRVATGDWDIIIVPQTSFTKIPVDPETEANYLREQVAEYRAALEEARAEGESEMSTSQMENVIAGLEARLQEKLDAVRQRIDLGITWEETGIDALLVDEAHEYRKLPIPTRLTNVAGVPSGHSQRAIDMMLKVRDINMRTPGRNIIFATGTPLMNSVAEMYVVQTFLQPEALKRGGMHRFDAWAANFGKRVVSAEMNVTGTKMVMKERFIEFDNVAGMVQMFRSFADVVRAADIPDFPRPKMVGGEEQLILAPGSERLKAFLASLEARAKNLDPRDRKTDNMLKISGDGRKAALDLRMVGIEEPGRKLSTAANKVLEIAEKWKAQRGTQLIFLDLGTAKEDAGGFQPYRELKRLLVDGGLKPSEVEFIQDAKTPEAKKALFARMRKGDVRVMIGSSQTMGVGVNVQKRIVAMHHLDAPWLPAFIEQRNGRGIRQGNMFFEADPAFEVEAYAYATEGSFDAYMWQLVQKKAFMIAQALSGSLAITKMDDISGGLVLTAAQIAAVATGNPIMRERVEIDHKLMQLSLLRRAHIDSVAGAQQRAAEYPRKVKDATEAIPLLDALSKTLPAAPVEILGTAYADVEEANAAVREWAKAHFDTIDHAKAAGASVRKTLSMVTAHRSAAMSRSKMDDIFEAAMEIGVVAGQKIVVSGSFAVSQNADADAGEAMGAPRLAVYIDAVANRVISEGLVVKPVSRLLAQTAAFLVEESARLERMIPVWTKEAQEAAESVTPWPREAEYQQLITRADEIRKLLNETADQGAADDPDSAAEDSDADDDGDGDGDAQAMPLAPGGVRARRRLTSGAGATPLSGLPVAPRPQGAPPATVAPRYDRRQRPMEIIRELGRIFDTPVLKGGFRARAAALFSPDLKVIRTKLLNDLPLMTHEFGHKADQALGLDLKDRRWKDELFTLGAATSRPSYTKKQQRQEGVAEFFRLWLTDPTMARHAAPQFLAAFEAAIDADPDMGPALRRVQDDVQRFLAQDAPSRMALRIDFDGKSAKAPTPRQDPAGWLSRMATWWSDDLRPLRKAVEALAAGLPIDPLHNAYLLARLARGAATRAHSFITEGVRAWDGTFIGGGASLEAAIKQVGDELETFAVYLVALRTPGLHQRGIDTGFTTQEAQETVRAIEARPDAQRFIQARDLVYRFQDSVLAYAVRGGVLKPRNVRAMKDRDAFYVPFQRVLDGDAERAGQARRIADRSVPIFRIKGSGREIINPLESIIKNTYAMVDMVEKNRAMVALVEQSEAAERAGRGNQVLVPYAPKMTPTELNISQILETFYGSTNPVLADIQAAAGLTGDETVTQWTPMVKGQKGAQVVTVVRNGEVKLFQVVDPALYEAVTAILPPAPEGHQLFAFAAGVLRAGATLTPGFILRNPARDTLTAWLQSRHGFIPVYDTAKGIARYVMHEMGLRDDEDVRLFFASGVAQAALSGVDRKTLQAEIRRMARPQWHAFARSVVANPLELMKALSTATEVGTRLSEFSNALDMGGQEGGVLKRLTARRGAVTADSLAVAALAARDVTTDFSRAGTGPRTINRYAAFFNARVQGYVRMAEATRRDPLGMGLKLGTLALLSVYVASLHDDDDDFAELEDWEKLTYWHIRSGDGFIRIPKPFDYAVVPDLLEALFVWSKRERPDAWRVLKARVLDIARQNALGAMPTLALPPLEVLANYSTFRQTYITPPWEERQVPTEDQYSNYTTETAKELSRRMVDLFGEKLALSPNDLDHLFFAYTAGVGRGFVEYGGDPLLAALGLSARKSELPARGRQGTPAIGSFMRDDDPGGGAPTLLRFFDAWDAMVGAGTVARRATGAKGERIEDLRAYVASAQTGDTRRLDRLKDQMDGWEWFQPLDARDNPEKRMRAAHKAIGDLRKEYYAILAAPATELTPEAKRQLIGRLRRDMIAYARYGLGERVSARYAGDLPVESRR